MRVTFIPTAIILGLIIFQTTARVQAQDIELDKIPDKVEEIKKNEPLEINGGFNLGYQTYNVKGIPSRYQPSIWTFNGNFNVKFYGYEIPVYMLLSQQNDPFRQPFNRIGIRPSYKWAKLHLGYSNITFSPFTLDGHTFLGAGVELNPENFRFALVYGRFTEAVREKQFVDQEDYVLPAYKRMGLGMKVGFGNEQNFIDFIMFRAKDDLNSIEQPTQANILPAENLVLGVNLKKALIPDRINFELEYANSAYTRDVRSEESSANAPFLHKNLGGLFRPRTSSQYTDAIRTRINYTRSWYNVFLEYKRIDPNYNSLGAYFFNNNLEAYTFNGNFRAFKNKLFFATSIGAQRNNLLKNEATTMFRRALAFNSQYTINKNMNINANYSNFSSTMEFVSDIFEESLDYIQISESAGMVLNFNKRGKNSGHNASLNVTYQTAYNESDNDELQVSQSDIYNGTFTYRYAIPSTNLVLSSGFNYNLNELDSFRTKRLGPNLGISKGFFNRKMRISLQSSLYMIYSNGDLANRTSNTRLALNYNISKSHTFSLGASMVQRSTVTGTQPSFTEFRTNFNYAYRFSKVIKLPARKNKKEWWFFTVRKKLKHLKELREQGISQEEIDNQPNEGESGAERRMKLKNKTKKD